MSFYSVWAQKRLPDGRLAEVIPLTFRRARLVVINRYCEYSYDDGW